jgi:zinc protease
LRLEADRMQHSLFEEDEVASERTVIISERQGSENSPIFRLSEELQAAAFRVHPYHHEVIGDMADLENLRRDDLYHHYRRFYHPANAVLTMAGDFESEAMLGRIRELFGAIAAAEIPVRLSRPEPPQNGERRLVLEGPGETTFVKACYHAPRAADPDFFPFTVLESLLTGPSSLNLFGGGISNKTSRLYRALVDAGLAVSIGGSLQATIDPFLYGITATVHPEKDADEVIRVLDKEMDRLQREAPTKGELARAVKQARALFAYGSESITNQAFWLGFAEMFADQDWFLGYLDNLAAVTPADVQHAAQNYLIPQNRILGAYRPTTGNREAHS